MANWELLDKEFYSAIDNMSDEDWDNWHENQDKNQSMRQEKMQNDWALHLIKLSTNDSKECGINKSVFSDNPERIECE